jgi:hypothetical protein
VRFWEHQDDDLAEQPDSLTLDFDHYQAPEATNDDYRLKRYHILAELAEELSIPDIDVGDAVYGISLEGRDAPMRTVTFMDQSDFGDGLVLQFTTYRTIALVKLSRAT